jgi:hypothetical protein
MCGTESNAIAQLVSTGRERLAVLTDGPGMGASAFAISPYTTSALAPRASTGMAITAAHRLHLGTAHSATATL